VRAWASSSFMVWSACAVSFASRAA
jgi:hypothetical protein